MISYEEYYPYGRSAYRAAASGVDLSLKRYRFTGKERDEETGLDYFGVRYYASWLGRWTSGDPGGFVDGLNLYRYVRNNPINGIDREGYSTEDADPPPLDPNGGALPEGAIVNSTFTQEYSEFSSGGGVAAPAIGSVRSYQLPTEGGGWVTYTAQFNKETGLFTGYKASAEELDNSADNLAYQITLDIERKRFQEIFEQERQETNARTIQVLEMGFIFMPVGLGTGAGLGLASIKLFNASKTLSLAMKTKLAPMAAKFAATRVGINAAKFAKQYPRSSKFLTGTTMTFGYQTLGAGIAYGHRKWNGVDTQFRKDIDVFDAAAGGGIAMIPGVPFYAKAALEGVVGIAVDIDLEGAITFGTSKKLPELSMEIATGTLGSIFKGMNFGKYDTGGIIEGATASQIKSMKFYNVFADFTLKGMEIPFKSIFRYQRETNNIQFGVAYPKNIRR